MAKNIPRIFIDSEISAGKIIPVDKSVAHYLHKVMRTNTCLIFKGGVEWTASMSDDLKSLIAQNKTNHQDSTLDITFCFSVIKKTDDLLNMITQMGVARIQPVITARTIAKHINWDRCKKIIIEAAEQSGRNSIPEILPVIKFEDLDKQNIIFADERMTGENIGNIELPAKFLIGPEGGFSDSEFAELESAGGKSVSLGGTILRAEVAAVAMCAKLL